MSKLNKEIDTSTLVVHFGEGITSEEGHLDDTIKMLAAQVNYLYQKELDKDEEINRLTREIESLQDAIDSAKVKIKDSRFLMHEARKARQRINTIIHSIEGD